MGEGLTDMPGPDGPKVVFRASRAAPRSPDAPTQMKPPGYSGYIPGSQGTIEQNYFQVTKQCFAEQKARAATASQRHAGSGQPAFSPTVKPRFATAPPGEGAAKFLPGYGGFIPGMRFKFETSEGTLARSWAPRRPVTEASRDGGFGHNYSPVKSRPKARNDKYIIGYTGHLSGSDQ